MRAFLNHFLQKKIVLHCCLRILPSTSPCKTEAANVILKLHEVPKKSTNSAIYRSHFSEIINSFPNAVFCYTDDTKFNNRVGGAFSIGNETTYFRRRNSTSILTAELQAIFLCLENILSRSLRYSSHFLLCSDSLSAINAIANTSSSYPIISRIQTLITTLTR